MNSTPLVSFIVPCYNYGRYIAECLSSIFALGDEYDYEVIVIDDGSTDDTLEVVRSFADSRLRLIIHEVNEGHVATINEGMYEARGEFVARIDPDDRYRANFLSETIPLFSKYPDVGLVYGDAAIIDENGAITTEHCDEVHDDNDYKGNEFVKLLESNFITAPTVIARREAWQNALPVPEGLAFNDWYFTLQIAMKYDFYYINKVLAEYRVHSENHHGKIIRDKSEESSIFRLLDEIYSRKETNVHIESMKRKSKNRIYGSQYLDQANKYFGREMDYDSRRCYLKAIRYRPLYGLRPDVLRHLIGTFVGRSIYEGAKSLIRSLYT